jgi:hypothetical protein
MRKAPLWPRGHVACFFCHALSVSGGITGKLGARLMEREMKRVIESVATFLGRLFLYRDDFKAQLLADLGLKR